MIYSNTLRLCDQRFGLRSRVLIIYVGACYTRGAESRRSCGVWGRRGRGRGGGGINESYVPWMARNIMT